MLGRLSRILTARSPKELHPGCHKLRAGDSVRLHLGCGAVYLDGYVNMDADSAARCDLRADFTSVAQHFERESVMEVLMIHSLSYLPLWTARKLIRDLYDLLMPGGVVAVEFPDVVKTAKMLLECEPGSMQYIDSVRAFYAFGREHLAEEKSYTPYAFGWSAMHLAAEFKQAGFGKVDIMSPKTHDTSGRRDSRLEAEKSV